MSLVILPSFQPQLAGAADLVGGDALFDAWDDLNQIPMPEDVQRLQDYRDARSELEAWSPEEKLPEDTPHERWHTAEQGLATLRALKEHLAQDPNAVVFPDLVLQDLDGLEKALEAAHRAGAKFHLNMMD